MSFIKELGKNKEGIKYIGIYKSIREGKKVKQKCIIYLGREDKYTATELRQFRKIYK